MVSAFQIKYIGQPDFPRTGILKAMLCHMHARSVPSPLHNQLTSKGVKLCGLAGCALHMRTQLLIVT